MESSTTPEERIRAALPALSPSHRRLAEHLLASDSAAAFSTARQLAEVLGISEATVVRLAPELGYEGFPALQAAFRERLLARVAWPAPLRQAIDSLPDDPAAVLHQVIQNDLASLQETLATVAPEAFSRAVEAIVAAETIYVLGLRTSAAHAIYAANRLRLIHPDTRVLSLQVGDLPDQMLALRPADLLIAISYLRYSADTISALRFASAQGARTILVTDDPLSPPARHADLVLIARGTTSRLFHSLVAPLSVLNALVAAAAIRDKDRARQNIARAYQTIDEFGVLIGDHQLDDLWAGQRPLREQRQRPEGQPRRATGDTKRRRDQDAQQRVVE